MKAIHITILLVLCIIGCTPKLQPAKTESVKTEIKDARGNAMLLGSSTEDALLKEPFKSWYAPNYQDYKIDSQTANRLSSELRNKTFEIFMGTWCGDSKREVPRMFKILHYYNIPSSKIKLTMLDYQDSLYKQSPGHEEIGKNIHRVPDLIVYENGTEIGRIVESPIESLEKDLAHIVINRNYEPHYKAVTWLSNQFNNRKIEALQRDSSEVLKSLSALAENSYGLNTYGYVLCAAKKWDEAVLVFTWNAFLFPREARVYNALGDYYLARHEFASAKFNYQKVLSIDPNNANAKTKLEEL